METTTSGLQLKTQRRWLADLVELLSSMRFAISLLTLISIASVIGTVLKQNEPMTNYVNQFGPFWFEVFGKLGLYAVYSTWWFLLIMAFLVVSTSLCIARNAPKMLKDMRSWRENVREQSLRNFHHKAEWQAPMAPAELVSQLLARVHANGYKARVVDKGEAMLITAKQGAANKWGYIFAHSAIVIICVGGLLDSDLPIRYQEWMHGKTPFGGTGVIAQIPAKHRLSQSNPSFRGNTFIPEGASSNTAILPRAKGVLIQDLPFTLQLDKFIIDYYSTGMPKLFASEVTVIDHDTGKRFSTVIKVNQPLIHKGMAVYQSSFDDGGSKLKLAGYPMNGSGNKRFELAGEVGGTTPLAAAQYADYTVEWSGFRPFNVENMANNGQDVRAVNPAQSFNQRLSTGLDKQLGSAARGADGKAFKNIGPSVQYKLRDKTGQAREFHNYMLPVETEGGDVFLAGLRESPSEPFRYLRIPADENASVAEWMRLRAALMTPELRQQAAQRYAERALPGKEASTAKLREQLQASAQRGLAIFAGAEEEGGYVAVSRFLQKVPADQQEKAADIFMKILNGTLWDLWQAARASDGLKAAEANEKNARFMQLAANALADSFAYGAPVYLQLQEFTEVKASVLQVTRSPGQKVVYLGCLLLVLGIFAMLYIRERRVWIWVKSNPSGNAQALMAMSSQRKTLDFEKEFEAFRQQMLQTGSASPENLSR
ncbi:cytochrome c biogenesis protein ResB [Janthinobacterium sp. 17J80-10]|uniref:cytochrome c biogenesis protein ResB n=1 Tax=Janthinobacterium sp. 17J80-10 TaxID=2497863 RepID=UPI0010057399|nr:cytochrome c biogenesis protein ResB [Janthinobacterium sp. 17J80-10]QAU35866.1 cytochrome c biogenesis protein ResB [Janthinobacterium sp. 17J80-10]